MCTYYYMRPQYVGGCWKLRAKSCRIPCNQIIIILNFSAQKTSAPFREKRYLLCCRCSDNASEIEIMSRSVKSDGYRVCVSGPNFSGHVHNEIPFAGVLNPSRSLGTEAPVDANIPIHTYYSMICV